MTSVLTRVGAIHRSILHATTSSLNPRPRESGDGNTRSYTRRAAAGPRRSESSLLTWGSPTHATYATVIPYEGIPNSPMPSSDPLQPSDRRFLAQEFVVLHDGQDAGRDAGGTHYHSNHKTTSCKRGS